MSEEEYPEAREAEAPEAAEPEVLEPTGWVKCPVCGEVVNVKGKFVHFKNRHPDLSYQEYKDRFVPAPPPKQPSKPKEYWEGPPYKGDTDANQILEEILERHPDIPDRVKEEVMDWARLKGFLQPMEVQAILQSMKGVSAVTANIVASKYAFALMKAQSEGKLVQAPMILPSPPTATQPQQLWLQPMMQYAPQPLQIQPIPPQAQIAPTTHQVQPPQPPQAPVVIGMPHPSQQVQIQPPTTLQTLQPYESIGEAIRRAVREEMERLRLYQQPQSEAYVEVEEPVKTPDGKVVLGPDDRPITRRVKVPVSQVDRVLGATSSSEERIVNLLKSLREIAEPKLTPEDVRRIIKEEAQQPKAQQEVTKEDIARIVSEVTSKHLQQIVEDKAKIEAEERKWRSLVKAIKGGFERMMTELRSSKTVEGFKDDSMRLLAQGLSELASTIRDTIRERRPIETVVKEMPRWLAQQPQPPPKVTERVGEPKIVDLIPKELVE